MNMGEFRELTADIPDDWPLIHVQGEDDWFAFRPADASVNVGEHQVEVVYPGITAANLPKRQED